MAEPLACPFCRRQFGVGEVDACPDCGLPLEPTSALAPLADGRDGAPILAEDPDAAPLPWGYLGRGRGALLGCTLAGLALCFAPWLVETAPEIRTLSGLEFARLLGWMWAPPIAWLIMLAVVATRRSIYHMRGARLAVLLLAALVVATVLMRIAMSPPSGGLVPRRSQWGWGLYATGALGFVAAALGLGFGGSRRAPR